MSKLKVKAVFFDLWNTIAFTDSDKEIFREMQIRFGLNELTHSQFLQECEKAIMMEEFESLEHLYSKLLHHFSIPSGEILLGDLDFLWNHALKHDKPFPESEKMLAKTKKHFKTALVSNCESFGFKKILNHFGFKKYFDEIILSCEVGLLKPHPQIFRLPLHKLKLKPEQAVMIGDSLRTDMHGAKHAGLKTILIDRKGKHKGRKIEADAVISSLNELNKVIEFK
ncbi:HAD family hydrolase [Candidatus Micrarchaeota archaeon]|nr:HAD family hydrolase [Candidatus Micrarchaeota archaeon]MBU2476618.1 HAD family hydrolase [Candidatus Micrarchaeota archaeon]